MTKSTVIMTALLLPTARGFLALSSSQPSRFGAGRQISSKGKHPVSYDIEQRVPLTPLDMGSNCMDARECEGCTVNSNMHSAKDWLYNVRTMPQSTVMREIRNPVITVVLWSTLVSFVHRGLIMAGKASFAAKMCISNKPHSFLVSSLGLLLVFRTNSAYQRFAEGRVIWERILSVSRNLSRFLTLYEDQIQPQRKRNVQKLLAAFPYLLRQHIRPRCASPEDGIVQSGNGLLLRDPPLAKVETRHEGDKRISEKRYSASRPCWVDRRELPWALFNRNTQETIARAENRPLWACDRMARELASIQYSDNFTSRERMTLLGYVEKLTDAIGQCERIHKTAVPLNYARHSLRSLTLWLFTLPFALIKDMGLLTAPSIGIVSWLLFGVYQIGYSIEDPFQGSIRLSTLCDVISRDVLGITAMRETAYDARVSMQHHRDNQEWSDVREILDSPTNLKMTVGDEGVAANHSLEGVGTGSETWM